jgi:hypothetical protein
MRVPARFLQHRQGEWDRRDQANPGEHGPYGLPLVIGQVTRREEGSPGDKERAGSDEKEQFREHFCDGFHGQFFLQSSANGALLAASIGHGRFR